MEKPLLDLRSPNVTQASNPGPRLLVLVDPLHIDANTFTSRVWQLADANAAEVLLLALYSEPEQEMAIRRSLATMTALVNRGGISAQAEIVRSRDWLGTVRSRLGRNDIVVCCDGHKVGAMQRPVKQLLDTLQGVPIYLLTGMYPVRKPKIDWLSHGLAWGGSFAILALFSLFQFKMEVDVRSWSLPLQLVSLPLEVWLVLAWNSLLG